jgi:hypothetical protein
MKVVIQIDGGDIRGIMACYILKDIESRIGTGIEQVPNVALISGTSTGAVIGGCKAFGIPASVLYDLYTNDVIAHFKDQGKIWWQPWTWLNPVYKRDIFMNSLQKYLGTETKLKEVQKPYTAVAYGLCKNGSHFIKSWDKADCEFKLVDVISWSALSAAWYFGAIPVQGTQNCTIIYDLIEIMAKDWEDEEIRILSIGCGDCGLEDSVISYDKAKSTSYLKQVVSFLGQARAESTMVQVGAAEYVAANRSNIRVYRLNCSLPKDAMNFGKIEYKDLLIEKAKQMAIRVPIEIFNR